MKLTSIITFVLAGVLFIAINVLSGTALKSTRLDLTENRLYTLSQGSRNIAGSLTEPIRLRLYFSQKEGNNQPQFKAYGQRVRELLEEYSRYSKGKIRFEVVDPEPDTEAEDAAAAAGLYGMMTPTGSRFFFGLVGTNSTDQQEVIPFFDAAKEQFLEYDLTKLVYTLNNPKKKPVGLMSSLNLDGMSFDPMQRRAMPEQPWQIVSQMRQFYEVKRIEPTATSIPADIEVLVVVHPKTFSDTAIYAIDQFVMRGGKLIAFVDPDCMADQAPNAKQDMLAGINWKKASSLNRLTEAWGVRVIDAKVLADAKAGLELPTGDRQRPEMVKMLIYQGLRAPPPGSDAENEPQYLDPSDPVTGVLKSVNYITGGVIEQTPDSKVTLTPIMKSSSESMLLDQGDVQFMPQPKDLLKKFKSENKVRTLAARITGQAKSAFEKKPDPAPAQPGEPAPEPTPGEHLAESKGPINVILVADVDMLSDPSWVMEDRLGGQILLGYRKFADNGDFLLGALDNLIGSQDLLSVRARGEFNRPFTRVQEIDRAAEAKFRAKNQEVDARVAQTEERLKQLQAQNPGDGRLIMTPEVEAEVGKLKQDLLQARKDQRAIKRERQVEIEALGTKLKVLNIAAVPLLVCGFAIMLGLVRSARRRMAPR